MVQPDGVVKLMDFGIARLAQDRKLTSTGRTVGSLYYMSPEQIRGADDLDGRSDLYSLGVTLYECVTGRRPFEGDSDYSIMAAHIQQNPVPPVQLDPQVPAALNDVILMAIAKDRSVRFQSADAFRAALQGSVSGQHTAALPATLVQPQPPSAAYGAPAPSPSPTTPLPPPPPPPLSPPRVPTAVMAQPASPVPAPPPPVLMPGPRPVPASGAKGLIIGLAFLFVAAAGGVAYVKGPEWFGNAGDQKKEEPVQDPGPAVTPPSTAGSTTAGEPGKAATSTPPAVSAPPPKAVPATDDDPRPTQPAVSAAKNRTSTTPPTQQPTSTTAPATSTSTPAATEPPPVASNPAPATPARRTYQVEPPQQQPPQANPQLAREMAEAREKFNSLSIRYSTAQESLRRLEAQQQRQGFGMRRDIREAVTRFQYLMKEATDSMASRNVDAARTSLDMAEKNLDRIEKFLGN
jgi:eukaryotic-like serine/threonine-protein kinase